MHSIYEEAEEDLRIKGWSQWWGGSKNSKWAHSSSSHQHQNMKWNDSTVQGKTKHKALMTFEKKTGTISSGAFMAARGENTQHARTLGSKISS